MDRVSLINNLENDLLTISKLLRRQFRYDFLVLFCELEKELDIQKMYITHEGDN